MGHTSTEQERQTAFAEVARGESHMLNNNPPQITVRLRCRLPVDVALGVVTRRISLGYYGRASERAERVANGSNGRGPFIDSRTEVVERALKYGVCAPVGTIRYRLAS